MNRIVKYITLFIMCNFVLIWFSGCKRTTCKITPYQREAHKELMKNSRERIEQHLNQNKDSLAHYKKDTI